MHTIFDSGLPPTRGRRAHLWAIAGTVAVLAGLLAAVPGRAAGPVDHLGVSAPSTSAAGAALTMTVTAYDATNAVVTGYAGTIHVVAADTQATVPADYQFQAGDHGVHTFTNGVTLRTAGDDPLTVTDTSNTSINGSTDVNVSPGPASSFLVFGTSPTTPGAAITITAVALDAFGNTVTTYAGTVHFTSSDSSATLPADYTFTGTENGQHVFSNAVVLRTVGTQTVTLTDTSNSSVTGHTSVVVHPICPQSPMRTVLAAQFAGRPPIGLGDELAIVTNAGVCVLFVGVGNSFATPQMWSGPFYGTRATLAADVNGDGLVDLIAVNDTSTWVMLSTRSGFSAPMEWSNQPFYGSRATLAADITGTGNASLIAVNNTSTWVMTSNRSRFSPPAQWSPTPFYGSRGTFVSDVAMTGRPALIAVDDSSVWVMTSTGAGFASPAMWSPVAFYGSRATLATAEGSPELIAVNGTDQWILSSTGSAFAAPTRASSTPFYGTAATLPALVQGGTSIPDLVAVNASSIWVEVSFGLPLRAPTEWASAVP